MIKNYWDGIFAGQSDYYFSDYPSRSILLKLIKDGESLLDVGCGSGYTYKLLNDNDREILYSGMDYSEEAIKIAKERVVDDAWFSFKVMDVRNLEEIPENSFDTVYMRHCLENIEDWSMAIQQMFRICKKRVVIDMRRHLIDGETKIIKDEEGDSCCVDINYVDFNLLCRRLSVNVSYKRTPTGDSNEIVVIGKKMDEIVFTLDDFHETNHGIETLLKIKEQSPNMKVTLFAIPSKCSVGWLKGLKANYPWMEFAVHGFFHDVEGGPVECSRWTKEDAHKYLQTVEDTFGDLFVKGFKFPGWQSSQGTYEALLERGYWLMDAEWYKHQRPKEFINGVNCLETGSLFEVNGHIQPVYLNGLEELYNQKNNFASTSTFYFASEVVGKDKIITSPYLAQL